MKKYIIGSVLTLAIATPVFLFAATPDPLALIAKIFGLQVQIQEQQTKILQEIAENTSNTPQPILGSQGSRSVRVTSSATASTSPTFFGVGNTKTATTTLLTVGCTSAGNQVNTVNVGDVDSLGLFILDNSTTTGSAAVFIEPKISNNCVDWYNMSSLASQVTTAGAGVDVITLSTASSTYLKWTPTSKGQQGTQFVLKDLVGKAIQFNVWAGVASSSVYLEAAEAIRR